MNIAPIISLPHRKPFTSASASERRVSVGDLRDVTLSIAARKRAPVLREVPDGVIMSIGAADDEIGTHYRNIRATAEALQAGHGFETRLTAGQLAEAIALYTGHDVRVPYALTPVICSVDESDAFLVSGSSDEADGRLTSAYAYTAGNTGVRTLEISTILERSAATYLAPEVPEGVRAVLQEMLGVTVALLGIIGDDRRRATFRPAPDRLNKVRRKAGRPEIPPVWQVDYVTRLGGQRKGAQCVAGGGAHASPRPHDRRGHRRRLRDGRVVWVRPCHVGETARHLTRGRAFYAVGES